MNLLDTLKQARDALNKCYSTPLLAMGPNIEFAITNLTAAIEQLEKQEPVAWVDVSGRCGGHRGEYDWKCTACGKVDWFASYTDPNKEGVKCSCHPAPAIHEGWQLVPERNRELDEFNEVGQAYDQGWNDCRKAMLSAVPQPPVESDELRAAAQAVVDDLGKTEAVWHKTIDRLRKALV